MKRFLLFMPMFLFFAACASATPTLVPSSSIMSAETAVPTIQSTFTSTPTLILSPDDYLLTMDELPLDLGKSNENIYLEKDGSVTYSIFFYDVTIGRVRNSINVALNPFTEFPDLNNYRLFYVGSDSPEIKEQSIGDNARAYQLDAYISYIFYKGNSLIQVFGDLSLQEAIALGKTIEDRLPGQVSVSPISFPEDLNSSAFESVLQSVPLLDQCNGSSVSVEIFALNDFFCLDLNPKNPIQKIQYAIFDVEKKVIIQKFIPEYGISNNAFLGIHHSGFYEIWLSADDVLIFKIPFEIR